MMTDRITTKHLKRAAIVYVRQSSPEQVRNHAESTRIQIGLRDKAVAFGWHNPVTIVDDLGISAGGFAHRAGFQHMAAEVSLRAYRHHPVLRGLPTLTQLQRLGPAVRGLRAPRYAGRRSRSGL